MRETLAAATLTAGGIAGVGPVADGMPAPPNIAGFDQLTNGYQDYQALVDNAARRAFLDERKSYRPVLGVPPFGQGPGDITVFAAICEMIRKLNHMLLVGRYYGTQEDLGTVCILSSFMEDAVAIARMATDDVSVSCQAHYQLHGALLALL